MRIPIRARRFHHPIRQASKPRHRFLVTRRKFDFGFTNRRNRAFFWPCLALLSRIVKLLLNRKLQELFT